MLRHALKKKRNSQLHQFLPPLVTFFLTAALFTVINQRQFGCVKEEPPINKGFKVSEDAEEEFFARRYLYYVGGTDYNLAGVHHYMETLSCAVGEAMHLNRTLVIHDTFLVSQIHDSGRKSGGPFSLYFDINSIRRFVDVIEDGVLFQKIQKIQSQNIPFSIANFTDSIKTLTLALSTAYLVQRNFTSSRCWGYCVCLDNREIDKPNKHIIGYSKPLVTVAMKIGKILNWDYDAVHIRRGDKAERRELWPHVERDTKPPKLLKTLKRKLKPQRTVYLATNEKNLTIFDPLKKHYVIKFQKDFYYLWKRKSVWWRSSKKIISNYSVEPFFDPAMQGIVDYILLKHAKVRLETFNDLTSDLKDGVGIKPSKFD